MGVERDSRVGYFRVESGIVLLSLLSVATHLQQVLPVSHQDVMFESDNHISVRPVLELVCDNVRLVLHYTVIVESTLFDFLEVPCCCQTIAAT